MALLSVRGLTKRYGGRKVLDSISFEVHSGEIVGLLGRNGSGKTTAFKSIMGLVRPEEGRILLEGDDLTGLPMYRRARKGLGYLSQEPSVFQRMTVEENLLAVLETLSPAPPPAEARRIAAVRLQEFGLARLARQAAYTLSGGESRRLEICRALLTAPSLILLDEPFSGVDPIAVGELQEIICRLRDRGMGILLTDHNVRDTLAVTDRSYIIFDGKILKHGTPAEIVEDPLVKKTYLGERFRL